MKIAGGVPRGNVVPLLLSHSRTSTSLRISSSSISDHVSFVKDVAATQPPQHLSQLLNILKTKGETIISPGAKQGLIPLAIPLSKNSSGAITALLRWPTAPPKLELPVVEVRKNGVWLLAKSVDQFIHRILVEEDAKSSQERNEELFDVSADAGEKLYRKGDFAESGISNLDVYLLKKVGLFPDVLERKVSFHFEKGDQVSALVTGEFYTKKEHFPGFARPYVFNIFNRSTVVVFPNYALPMRRWRKWEDETQTIEYQIAHDSRRFQHADQTSGGKRHLKFWSNYSPLLWMVCFMRQFYVSVSKDDYFALRNGFISANISQGSNFNFKKFLSRAYDRDFEKVAGTRFWIWVFSILFIFLSAHEFYNYFWLPFIPLLVALLAGTKLQVIITKMYVDSCKESPVTIGTILVRPSNEYFWFHRPEWLLLLLQFILIQNSFQLAFFTWTWYEFGPRSCFNREKEDIAIRIVLGLAVQLLCGYVTLPLYALVTQMGSNMRMTIFTERVAEGLKKWQKKAKQSVSKNNSTCSRHLASLHSKTSENSVRDSLESMHNQDNEDIHSAVVIISLPSANNSESEEVAEKIAVPINDQESTSEITIVTEEDNPKIITRGNYDGEISFGSSWKDIGSSRGTGEILSIAEEDDTDKVPELIP